MSRMRHQRCSRSVQIDVNRFRRPAEGARLERTYRNPCNQEIEIVDHPSLPLRGSWGLRSPAKEGRDRGMPQSRHSQIRSSGPSVETAWLPHDFVARSRRPPLNAHQISYRQLVFHVPTSFLTVYSVTVIRSGTSTVKDDLRTPHLGPSRGGLPQFPHPVWHPSTSVDV